MDRVLAKNGALSFPHTYLDHSMEPLIRVVRAIRRSGARRVLAIGVLHLSLNDRNCEFCLDGFKFMMELANEVLDLEPLPLEELYVTRPPEFDQADFANISSNLEKVGANLRKRLSDDTAIVVTGDLSHWGHAYMKEFSGGDPEKILPSSIRETLEYLYIRKDHIGFLERAKVLSSDQLYAGIVVSSALEGPLEYTIFSDELTDYSEVLGSVRPTVVASVFYGVNRI